MRLMVAANGTTAPVNRSIAATDETRERFLRFARGGFDRAYRLAGLILGDSADAEDAVQDALLRAWRSAYSLRDPADFEPWFDRILVNGCRDRLRRRRTIRFVALGADDERPLAIDPFEAILDGDVLLSGLRALGPDERIVVVLHYWADLRLEDVAARLGWPLGTVKSRLHRALVTLRTYLQGDLEAHRD
jgi:RNA polymerase sigma-70 factor (ECF subfamily)